MRIDRPGSDRPDDPDQPDRDRPQRPSAEQGRRTSDLRDDNGLNPAEYIAEWNKKVEAERATEAERAAERPTVLRDSNGLTGAELRFRHNKRIEEAEAKAAAEKAKINSEASEPEVGDLPDVIRAARDHPKEYAASRSVELQSMLPEARRGRITMGVGVGTDAEGGTRVVIGTSEDNGYLRKPLQAKDGEEVAEGRGHAETSILDYMTG